MKKISMILSGLIAIALAACTNEALLPETQPGESAGQTVTVTAYTADEGASTRIVQSWEGDVMKLSWSSDDKFSVIRGGANSTFSKSTETGAGVNDFTGTLPAAGEGVYYASYPVTGASDHTAVPFDISEQNEAMSYLMYTESTGETFSFHHALAYLKATLPETLKGKTLSITLTLPAGVYADGNIDLTSGTLSGGSAQSISKTVTLSDESSEVFIAVPPMPANNKTLKFLVTEGTNNYVATLAGSAEKAIEAGIYYSATIALTEASTCSLPNADGITNAFNSAIDTFLGSNTSLTKIKFIANSDKSATGTQIETSGAYMVANGETLEIHTAADVFVFPTSCARMFYDLTNINSIDFNDCINTAQVKYMNSMFMNCSGLNSIDLSKFNTSNVTKMIQTFTNCSSLTSIDLSSFNTAKVNDMFGLFLGNSSLTSITFSNDFITSVVGDMRRMFDECNKLNSLDLRGFTFNASCSYENMFRNTGSGAAGKPIPIYVKDASDKARLEAAGTGINSSHAEILVQ